MSHKDRSIANMRCEAKKIYHQRREINRLVSENNTLKEKIEYLENDVNCLKDELEWYKQQCDDLEMQIGCEE